MKAVFISSSRAQYGKASGIEMILEVDGKERKQFLMPYGDSKPVYEKMNELNLKRGDHIELKMQKTTKNGKDYWNPISIDKISASTGPASTGGHTGPSGNGVQFRSVEELNRIDCMKIAAQIVVPILDKKMTPVAVANTIVDIACTLKANLDAEVFGLADVIADVDAMTESAMDEVPF